MEFLRITPLDIYQQEFKKVLRGVDPDEVEDFLERVADDYEQVLKENAELKKQIESLKKQLATGMRSKQASSSEVVVREKADDVIRDARKEAENIIRQAKTEAENIIRKAGDKAQEIRPEAERISDEALDREVDLALQEARRKSDQIVETAKMEELELRREISRLRGQKERFLLEYRELLEKHLKLLIAESSDRIGE
jgi:cell division initiation protein